MNSLEMSGAGIRAREEALRQALENPVRKHDADGIGGQYREAADLALEFVADCCNPESYGHALPAEVVARAGRIRAMLRPKEPPKCGVGYQEPPPARCEACDNE